MDSLSAIDAVRAAMDAQGIGLLLAFHDGAHFIEKSNAVMVLSGFKGRLNDLPRCLYTARGRVRRPAASCAIVSAMVVAHANGSEVLWSAV